VRGETDDYDEEEDIDEDESLAADSPQVFRAKKHSQQLQLSHRYSSSGSTPSSAFQIPSSPTVVGLEKNEPEPANVHDLFPTFVEGGILQFTDLFATVPRKRQKVTGGYVDVNLPETLPPAMSTSYLLENPTLNMSRRTPDQSKLPRMLEESYQELLATLPPVEEESNLQLKAPARPLVEETSLEQLLAQQASKCATPWRIPHDDRGWQALSMQDWESDIIWKPQPSPNPLSQPIDTLTRLSRPRNPEVEEGDWLDCIIYDAKNRPWKDFTTLHVVEEDARSLSNNKAQGVEIEKEVVKSKAPIARTSSTLNRDGKQQALDPFNLSNDRFYEVSKEHRRRVRQTFGNLEVQHSYPAMKLQLPLVCACRNSCLFTIYSLMKPLLATFL
jgi:transcription initiation factor TFIID subunit 1